MLKMKMTGKSGTTLVLGLERSNVDRLKNDEPIFFNLQGVDIDHDIDVLIVYVRKDGRGALPKDLDRSRTILLFVTDEILDRIFVDRVESPVVNPFQGSVVLFAKESNEELDEIIKQLATPKSIVRRSGFMPGSFPSNN